MLEVRGFRRRVKHFSLSVPEMTVERGEVFVLLGPTGAGKSQLLQTLAGFFPLQEGEIRVNGANIAQVPPEGRGISILFQSPHLFPHLSAAENIGFGSNDSVPSSEQLVELLGLQQVENCGRLGVERRPAAAGRSGPGSHGVVPGCCCWMSRSAPSTLQGRKQVIEGFKRVQATLGITCLMVTHNFEDCLKVGDRVGVLLEGNLVQTGDPEGVFRTPASSDIARFLGLDNIFAGTVKKKDSQGPDPPGIRSERSVSHWGSGHSRGGRIRGKSLRPDSAAGHYSVDHRSPVDIRSQCAGGPRTGDSPPWAYLPS